MPLSEIIGLVVALLLALGLLSLLLVARGSAAGLPPRAIHQTLISVWLMVLAVVGLLFGLRAVLGVDVVAGSPSEGFVPSKTLPSWGWGLIGFAAAVLVAAGWWLRRLLQPFTAPLLAKDMLADETC